MHNYTLHSKSTANNVHSKLCNSKSTKFKAYNISTIKHPDMWGLCITCRSEKPTNRRSAVWTNSWMTLTSRGRDRSHYFCNSKHILASINHSIA